MQIIEMSDNKIKEYKHGIQQILEKYGSTLRQEDNELLYRLLQELDSIPETGEESTLDWDKILTITDILLKFFEIYNS